MERMRSSRSISADKNEFDSLVSRKRVHRTRWQKVLSTLGTAENLQENRDCWINESDVVNQELAGGKIESKLKRNDNVSITEGRTSWRRW
jgi:hypothetical protein